MKLAIFVFTLCFAATLSLDNSEGEWIPGGIVGPIKNLIKQQTKAILISLKDQAENLSHTAKLHLSILAGLIKPHVKEIIDRAKNTGKTAEQLTTELTEVVKNIIGSIWKVTEENINATKTLVKYLVNALLIDFRPKTPQQHEPYSMINDIVSKILESFLTKVEGLILRIDEAKSKMEEEQTLQKFRDFLVKLFKEPIMKISNVLSNMVGELENVESLIMKLSNNHFDKLKGIISDETIKFLKNIVEEILKNMKKEKEATYLLSQNAQDNDVESYLILDKAISLIFKPIIDKINTQLEAIKKAMIENTKNAKEAINKHAEALSELLRPYMIRVINLLNDLGADGKASIDQMKKLLTIIINNISEISKSNKEIFLTLIDYMSKILAGKLPDEMISYELVQYNIKDIIVEAIIKPVVALIHQQVLAISRSLKDQAGNLSETTKQHLKQLAILLKPIIEQIIKNGSGIIDASKDIKDQVLQALKYIFGIVGEIPGVSAELLAEIFKYLVNAIIGTKL